MAHEMHSKAVEIENVLDIYGSVGPSVKTESFKAALQQPHVGVEDARFQRVASTSHISDCHLPSQRLASPSVRSGQSGDMNPTELGLRGCR